MNYFVHRTKLYQLEHQRKKYSKIFYEAVEEAKKRGGWEEEQKALATESVDLDMVNEEIAFLKSWRLRNMADKRSLPVPEFNVKDEYWEQGHYTGKWFLSSKGITEVRRSILIDKRQNLELVALWASIAIGVIGAITGLMAVILK